MTCARDTYSPDAAVASSQTCCSGMNHASQSSTTTADVPFCGIATADSTSRRATCAAWVSANGMGDWMRSMLASHVLVGLRPAVAWAIRQTFHEKCCASYPKSGQSGCSSSEYADSSQSSQDCARHSGTLDTPLRVRYCWTVPPWVRLMLGRDAGLLATPTTMANQCSPSMQKHPGCRRLTRLLGKLTPRAYRWLMGWPIDGKWNVPVTDKSPCAPQSPGNC